MQINTDDFRQTDLGVTSSQSVINLSTFDKLGDAARETGDEWTAMVSYEMAAWTIADSTTSSTSSNIPRNSTYLNLDDVSQSSSPALKASPVEMNFQLK